MDQKVGMETDVIEQLIKLQEIDRKRDRLQKKLDDVPVKLKGHTDAIAGFEREIEDLRSQHQVHRTEADREELDVKSLEEQREELKRKMNAPGLGNREYQALQDQLTGVLADINSHSDVAIKAIAAGEELSTQIAALEEQLGKAQEAYQAARDKLEGTLEPTKADLEKRDGERSEYLPSVNVEALQVYERVRKKHKEALSFMDGTIDRAAGRMGNDLHCSACYMTVTANDALRVLARKELVQCKSCVRILYVA
ncbi:MAG: zinc ribbon domain-containing protein [Planctomycetota bacterium]|jgi:predicted  nucleic acid-binding Zn-ribbon protein